MATQAASLTDEHNIALDKWLKELTGAQVTPDSLNQFTLLQVHNKLLNLELSLKSLQIIAAIHPFNLTECIGAPESTILKLLAEKLTALGIFDTQVDMMYIATDKL
jgi:hypothetical protein